MSRLTDKNVIAVCAHCNSWDICKPDEACFVKEVYEKLKHLEDLEEQLIESAEIDIDNMVGEFMHYYNLQKENRLIELPCKVGDTVYLVCHKPTKCSKHQEYRDEYNCQGCEELYCDSRIEYYIHPIDSVKLDWIVRMEDCIGDTVFLTKEKAEAKLKELKGEMNETE